jgi:hypothetical protein
LANRMPDQSSKSRIPPANKAETTNSPPKNGRKLWGVRLETSNFTPQNDATA